MIPPIPEQLYALYSGLPFWQRWHVKWRWRLCPFMTIAAHVPPSGRIVDIGCGRGLLANYLALASPDRRVTGIDRQTQRIEAARCSAGSRGNIRFLEEDVLDLKMDEYDVIVISDMLHHLPHPLQEKLLSHCREILPPGGLLLIEDVGDRPRWKWISHLIIDRSLNLGRKQYYRRPPDWIKLLEGLGFSVRSVPAHRGIPLSDVLFICVRQ